MLLSRTKRTVSTDASAVYVFGGLADRWRRIILMRPGGGEHPDRIPPCRAAPRAQESGRRVAHAMLLTVYHLLTSHTTYHDPDADYYGRPSCRAGSASSPSLRVAGSWGIFLRGTRCQFITWPQPVNPHRGSLSLPRVAQGIVAKSGLSTDSLRPSSIAHGFGSACRTCSPGPGMRVAPLGFREEQP